MRDRILLGIDVLGMEKVVDRARLGPPEEFEARVLGSLRRLEPRDIDWKGLPYEDLREIVRILGQEVPLGRPTRRRLEQTGRQMLHRWNRKSLFGSKTCRHCGREMEVAEHVTHEPFCAAIEAGKALIHG